MIHSKDGEEVRDPFGDHLVPERHDTTENSVSRFSKRCGSSLKFFFSVNDDSDDEPVRKKYRSIWDESETESDKSWGRRKKKYTVFYCHNV